MKKKLPFNQIAIAVFTALIFTLGCKRTEITETPNTPNTPPTTNPIGSVVNDATQVTASVSGIVLDENLASVGLRSNLRRRLVFNQRRITHCIAKYL
jgi:hypothetical protein